MAKHLGHATKSRLAVLARARTPAVERAELPDLEAGFQREAAIRKAQSQSNALRWYAVRKARGTCK